MITIPKRHEIDIENSDEGRQKMRELILPFLGLARIVNVGEFLKEAARNARNKSAAKRMDEGRYGWDHKQLLGRFECGEICEFAIGILLAQIVVDPEVGDCQRFRAADLLRLGIHLGVKGVKERNTFPLIPPYPAHGHIICSWDERDIVKVHGVAKADTIVAYNHKSLAIDSDVRGDKNGFYGFHDLFRFQTLASPELMMEVLRKEFPVPKTPKFEEWLDSGPGEPTCVSTSTPYLF